MGRTTGRKAPKKVGGPKAKLGLFDQVLALHRKRLPEKELVWAQREKETAKQEKQREYAKREAVRAATADVMPAPPYTKKSTLVKKAVKAVEEELLLNKRHRKFGNAGIVFGYHVKDYCGSHYSAPINFPGWPTEWPQGTTKAIVREYASQCMHQVLEAFIEAHPEWKRVKDNNWEEVYPSVSVRADGYINCLTFYWAHED